MECNNFKKTLFMKAIKLTLFSLIGLVTFSFAQQKAVEKVVIKTPTVQCENCKERNMQCSV